ncbi:hypothetical protein ANN_05334 [Periplaneta americana]|uniref:Uncharacterized protein n=1 Tax=Periplaneta americana TaxID=6978 RepID=A0ABQ8TCM4_PERAM|nr:hypothetical protein ANN_05334 [Periplaneta americana]
MIEHMYNIEALDCSAVFRWQQRFAKGRDSFEDDEHTGRSKTVQTKCNIAVTMLVHADCSQLVDDLAAAVRICHGMYHKILSDDLNMLRVTLHTVPHVLMQDQCDDHMTICGDLIRTMMRHSQPDHNR